MKHKVLILNGPGLADLSDYDGHGFKGLTLKSISEVCVARCKELGIGLDFRQTDNQDEMARWIAKDSEVFDAVIINPSGYSRATAEMSGIYRSALRKIAKLKKPVIEVHINNIYSQSAEITQPLHEPAGDMGFVCGFGKLGYVLAINAIDKRFDGNVVA